MLKRIMSAANTVGAFAAKLLGGWSMTQELLFRGPPQGRRFCAACALRKRWCLPSGGLASPPVCANGQAVTVLPAGYGYLAGMTQEAAGAGENTRKFRGDAVSTRKRLMAKNATPSIMQRKRENFMARLRCPKQAAASGKEPLQAVACYFRQTDRTSLTTTGYTVHNGSWFGVKG